MKLLYKCKEKTTNRSTVDIFLMIRKKILKNIEKSTTKI